MFAIYNFFSTAKIVLFLLIQFLYLACIKCSEFSLQWTCTERRQKHCQLSPMLLRHLLKLLGAVISLLHLVHPLKTDVACKPEVKFPGVHVLGTLLAGVSGQLELPRELVDQVIDCSNLKRYCCDHCLSRFSSVIEITRHTLLLTSLQAVPSKTTNYGPI